MLTGKRILVVEDEAMVAMMLEDEILRMGAEVEIAATVDRALQILDEVPIDAAILDCNLNGISVTPVADMAVSLDVPFLFATGYGCGHNKGVHVNVVTIGKPYDAEQVVLTVAGFFVAGGSNKQIPPRSLTS